MINFKFINGNLVAEHIKDTTPQEEHRPSLERVKAWKIDEINGYDTSEAVNCFVVAGVRFWLSKADRVGLVNSTNILKAKGIESTILWLNGTRLELDCDVVLDILAQIEIYALQCYSVTEAHKAAVSAMTSVEAVSAYDHTAGYPSMLTFDFDML